MHQLGRVTCGSLGGWQRAASGVVKRADQRRFGTHQLLVILFRSSWSSRKGCEILVPVCCALCGCLVVTHYIINY